MNHEADYAHAAGELRNTSELPEAVNSCRRCSLWKTATQGVPGEGKAPSGLMLVGEAPGDSEDLKGHPFVGPAGAMLDRALEEAGMDRQSVYVTNAVKHFKFEPRGKRRLHVKPSVDEIQACNWWLEEELRLVSPEARDRPWRNRGTRAARSRGDDYTDPRHADQVDRHAAPVGHHTPLIPSQDPGRIAQAC